MAYFQVVRMSFYDVVLDFLIMDAFDDLSNPPSPVTAIMQNKWLADSLKESVRLILQRDTKSWCFCNIFDL